MSASFPIGLKVFTTYHDYTDVIWAYSVNEIHDEIVAIEQVLGTTPFSNTPYTSFAGAIQDLYTNKAPSSHTHVHSTLLEDNQGNDHPQYIMVSGYPGFSRAVGGQHASAPNHLLPLSQLQGFGYQTAGQVAAAVENAVRNLMSGANGGPPLAGPAVAPNFIVQGGTHSGCTDSNGQITVSFGTVLGTVQSFVATKIPPAGGQPCPPYNWIEAQVTLVGVSGYGATVQFSHDYSWQPNMAVSFSWIAIGMLN
jgi:hypothetical protein